MQSTWASMYKICLWTDIFYIRKWKCVPSFSEATIQLCIVFFHFIKTKKLQTSSQGATDIHITYQYLKKSVEFLDSLGGTSFIK